MKAASEPRKPIFQHPIPMPIWWHQHGTKMQVKNFDIQNHTLLISGSAANVKITPYPIRSDGWWVDWEVIHSANEKAGGRAYFTTEELRAAFGLSPLSGDCGDWLIKRFGGESAEQGKWIRHANFLNIPGPGTGHDSDPNVSISVRTEIQEAVMKLVGRQ